MLFLQAPKASITGKEATQNWQTEGTKLQMLPCRSERLGGGEMEQQSLHGGISSICLILTWDVRNVASVCLPGMLAGRAHRVGS